MKKLLSKKDIQEQIKFVASYCDSTTKEVLNDMYNAWNTIGLVRDDYIYDKFNKKFKDIELIQDENGFRIDVDNKEAECYLEKILNFAEGDLKYKIDDSEF